MSEVEKLQNLYMDRYKQVLAQREEILEAFVAKYGCEPDEICQVEWHKSSYETIWTLKPRDFFICSECQSIKELPCQK